MSKKATERRPGGATEGPIPLTKSRVRKDKGLFLRFMKRWMADESRRKQMVKSRRIGISYGHAYDRVSRRMTGLKRNAYYTGINLEMTREYMDYCAFHARMFSFAAKPFEEDYSYAYRDAGGKRRKIDVTAYTIRFPNGSKIVALPSRPAAFRGRGGDVDADEWAFHEDQDELYMAAVHVIKWGGQFAGWSSHNGEGTPFFKNQRNSERALQAAGGGDVTLKALERAARKLRIRPVFSLHKCTIVDAIDQGLVELMNRVSGMTHTRESFLDECRDECLNEDHFGQEYMCRPSIALMAALRYSVIEACYHEACPLPVDECERLDEALAALAACYSGGPVHIGMDIGRTQDLSVIWVWEAVGDVLWTRLIFRMSNTDLVDQNAALAKIIRAVRLARCAILKRGIGVGILDYTARTFGEGRIVGIDETNPVKVGLAAGIIQAFGDRSVRIPPDDRVKESLHAVREQRTPGNLITYDAPRGAEGHADEFWAAAAGIDSASLAGGGLSAEDVRVLAKVAGVESSDQSPLTSHQSTDIVRGRRGFRW